LPSLASRVSASGAGSKVVALLVSRLLVVMGLLGWDVAPALGLFRPNSPLLVSDSAARESEVTVPRLRGYPPCSWVFRNLGKICQ
jgi:hypothetical protein